MTTEFQVFQGKFGFHACDRETYKKIKRIRHLIEQCRGRNNQFNWFWRKAPQNRLIIVRDKGSKVSRGAIISSRPMPEPKLYERFFTKTATGHSANWYAYNHYDPEQYKYSFVTTPEYGLFMETYRAARHPAAKAEDVIPLKHSVEQIDEILQELETFFCKKR